MEHLAFSDILQVATFLTSLACGSYIFLNSTPILTIYGLFESSLGDLRIKYLHVPWGASRRDNGLSQVGRLFLCATMSPHEPKIDPWALIPCTARTEPWALIPCKKIQTSNSRINKKQTAIENKNFYYCKPDTVDGSASFPCASAKKLRW